MNSNRSQTEQMSHMLNGSLDDPRIHARFLTIAAQNPESIAVIWEGDHITYGTLSNSATKVAHGLIGTGVGPGSLVAICIERSPDMIAAVVATLMVGAAYLPLDRSDPIDKIKLVVAEASPSVIITDDEDFHSFAPLITTGADVLSIRNLTNRVSPPNLELPIVTSSAKVYVIYTSGSTGTPKGVVMTHGSLEKLIQWQINVSQKSHVRAFGPASEPGATLQYTPLTFDVSFLEIFSTLCAGRTLVLPSKSEASDPLNVIELVEKHRVGSIFLPLTVLNVLAEFALSRGHRLTSLFEVSSGGEQLRITPSIRKWFTQMPWCTLHNIYGPTEAHVVTAHSLKGDAQHWPVLPPIGRPIDGATILLLDDDMRPVANGEVGEICVGGCSLAEGYLNRPDLTAARFVTVPTTNDQVYLTGDLGHWQPDGSLAFDGRKDDQVKVQGVRLELGEVESALELHPEVHQCAVVAIDSGYDKKLVAYLVLRDGSRHPEGNQQWNSHLSGRLSSTAIPSDYIIVESLPLGSSGKVDKKALLPPMPKAYNTSASPPRTAMEIMVSAIWCEHLQLCGVGIDEGFFELGGRSLMLVRVQGELCRRLKCEIALSTLLENPTVRTLSQELARIQATAVRATGGVEPARKHGTVDVIASPSSQEANGIQIMEDE